MWLRCKIYDLVELQYHSWCDILCISPSISTADTVSVKVSFAHCPNPKATGHPTPRQPATQPQGNRPNMPSKIPTTNPNKKHKKKHNNQSNKHPNKKSNNQPSRSFWVLSSKISPKGFSTLFLLGQGCLHSVKFPHYYHSQHPQYNDMNVSSQSFLQKIIDFMFHSQTTRQDNSYSHLFRLGTPGLTSQARARHFLSPLWNLNVLRIVGVKPG